MAQIWVTGPAHIFAGTGSGTTPYLGTAEDAPEIEISPAWEGVRNDLGGVKYPYDYLFQGEEAFITATLTRWDESTYQALAARLGSTGTTGGGAGGSIGRPMVLGGEAITVSIQFPYSGGAFAGMPSGYTFPACMFEGPDRRKVGTGPNKLTVMFHAIRTVTISGGYTLYTIGGGGGTPT